MSVENTGNELIEPGTCPHCGATEGFCTHCIGEGDDGITWQKGYESLSYTIELMEKAIEYDVNLSELTQNISGWNFPANEEDNDFSASLDNLLGGHVAITVEDNLWEGILISGVYYYVFLDPKYDGDFLSECKALEKCLEDLDWDALEEEQWAKEQASPTRKKPLEFTDLVLPPIDEPELELDPNLTKKDLNELLAKAVKHDYVMHAKTLLEAGASPNTWYDWKVKVLMKACSNLNVKMVKLLVDAGAKVNYQNRDGYTALDCAKVPSVIFPKWWNQSAEYRQKHRAVSDKQNEIREIIEILKKASQE